MTARWLRNSTPLPDAPHVVVQGEGLVGVEPDSATVSMGYLQPRIDFTERVSAVFEISR